jgi:4-hydroxy-2-oxoheptanedioate aldolase
MNENRIKAMWKEGKSAVQVWSWTGHPEICKILAKAGFDAVCLDWQHGLGVTEQSLVNCIQAINTVPGVAALVRLPKGDAYYISHVLDAGAAGVIVPMVNTAEEAKSAGLACRYSPTGFRSLAHTPFIKHGETVEAYTTRANEEIICLVMIETRQAIENIESICSAPGIDGVYIGPYDLSLDMEVPTSAWYNDERHLAVVKRIIQVAENAGIIAGHHGSGPAISAKFVKMGAKTCHIGTDSLLLSGALRASLKAFQEALEE